MTEIEAAVAPWYERYRETTFVRPLATRAILSAASFASVPEVEKNRWSTPGGRTVRSASESSALGPVANPGAAYGSSRAWRAIASWTARLEWPRFVATSWLEKSRISRPSSVQNVDPSARVTTSGAQPPWRRQVT